jgi:hypothetical protein
MAPAWRDGGGVTHNDSTRQQVESNRAIMVASRSIRDPTTAIDDVLVDGKVITAENFDSARQYGRTVADYLLR